MMLFFRMSKWLTKQCVSCKTDIYFLEEWTVKQSKCELCRLIEIDWNVVFSEIDSVPNFYEKKLPGIRKKLKSIHIDAKKTSDGTVNGFVQTFSKLVQKNSKLAKTCLRIYKEIKLDSSLVQEKIDHNNRKRDQLIYDGKRRIS